MYMQKVLFGFKIYPCDFSTLVWMNIPIVYYYSIKACDVAISNRALLTNQRSRNEFFFLFLWIKLQTLC